MTNEEFDQFLTNYYRSGHPNQAPEALTYLLNEGLDTIPEFPMPIALYFFARVAQTDPAIVREYERRLKGLSGSGVSVLLELLQHVGDEKTREFLASSLENDLYSEHREAISEALKSDFPKFQSALLRAVREALDLDLLWTEFLVTGNRDAVVKIIEVLDWTDLLRQKLQEWLNSEATGWVGGWRARRTMAQLQKIAGVLYDRSQNKIAGVEDLDTRCFLDGVNQDPERCKQVREALPFLLTAEELNHIAVKAMAKWSLASNACQHPRVLETCIQEREGKGLSTRLSLLEIEAEAHLSDWNTEEAAEVLSQYVQLNPNNQAMAKKHMDALSGVISLPQPEQDRRSVFARLGIYGPYAVLAAWIFWIESGDRLVEGFTRVLDGSFFGATIWGVVSFLLAVLLGAFRQILNTLLERSYPLETTEGTVYLGDTFFLFGQPAQVWVTPIVSAISWLVVGTLSLWAAGIFAVSRTPGSELEFGIWLAAVLFLRWLFSTLIRRGMFAGMHKSRENSLQEMEALMQFEEGVVKWADGLISEDQVRSLVDGLKIDTPSLVGMIQAGDSDLTEEHIQKVKNAKILDEL